MADDLPVEVLFEMIAYDPESCVFSWKYRDRKWFDCDRIHKCWNSRWAGKPAFLADSHGYMSSDVNGVRMYAHRAVWAFTNGEWPNGEIDHINGIRDDNRIENLRLATRCENNRNTGMRRNNTSGYKGVSFHRQTGKWRAAIWVNSKRKSLGLFFDPSDAYDAYCAASRRLHAEFSNVGVAP